MNSLTSLLAAMTAACLIVPKASAVEIGSYAGSQATLLAIDDYSLPLKKDLCFYISKPTVRAEPVLTPDRGNKLAPDASATHCYGTVLQEGGKFRMWYYAVGWKHNPEHKKEEKEILHEGPVCYAVSDDGLHWTKPDLGQVNYNGSTHNNAIALPAAETEGAFIIREDSDPDPARRYKMIYENTSGKHPTVDTAISPDGIHWTGTGTAEEKLEPSGFYKFGGLYHIGAQNLSSGGEGGHLAGRQGFTWVSTDFRHWIPEAGESFLLPEPVHPNARGYDKPYVQVHLGVGAVSLGNVLVGLYCQWHAVPQPGDWFGVGTTYGDFGLLVSNDGQHFREPVKGHVFLSRHHSAAAISPDERSEEVLTQSGNAILNVGDETRIYHGRWMNTEKLEDYYAEIALATLPRDRWGALGLYPHSTEGSVWTAPLTLGQAGAQVALNADGASGMQVEIADAQFHPLPDYSGANAGTVAAAGGLNCAVSWPKGSLDALQGRKVRLHLSLKKTGATEPRLFAIYLTSS